MRNVTAFSLAVQRLEEELDLFNIILARRQAEFEVEKLPKPEPKKGWLSGWWGGASKQEGKSEVSSSLAAESSKSVKSAKPQGKRDGPANLANKMKLHKRDNKFMEAGSKKSSSSSEQKKLPGSRKPLTSKSQGLFDSGLPEKQNSKANEASAIKVRKRRLKETSFSTSKKFMTTRRGASNKSGSKNSERSHLSKAMPRKIKIVESTPTSRSTADRSASSKTKQPSKPPMGIDQIKRRGNSSKGSKGSAVAINQKVLFGKNRVKVLKADLVKRKKRVKQDG